VEADYWHQLWDRGETGWDQPTPNRFLVSHWDKLNVPPGGAVFVPLCGKSEDMNWLVDAGHDVLGVELDESAVQAFFAERSTLPTVTQEGKFTVYRTKRVSIFVGDVFDLVPEQLSQAIAVYDRAALIALPAPMRGQYVSHLNNALPPQAKLLVVTFEIPAKEDSEPPFSVEQKEVEKLWGKAYQLNVLDRQPFDLEGVSAVEVVYRIEP
ncbi:UNVERIFIED_CONTAM: hypothetical protein GTU68_049267, partial [Idotea baltica]|nr:hypothetical protein [Idotea baltica]